MAGLQQTAQATTNLAPTAAERRLTALLRAFAGVFLLAGPAYVAAPFFVGALREAPFAANSVAKVTALGLAALYASGDVRRRRGLVAIVIAGHVVSVLAMLSYLLFADGDTALLPWAIALDGAITALLVWFFLAARGPGAEPLDDGGARAPLLIAAAIFAGAAVAYEIAGFTISDPSLPLASNSVVEGFVLAALCVYAARRELAVACPVAVALALSALAGAVLLIFDKGASWPVLAISAVASIVVGLVSVLTLRKRYGLVFFQPIEYRSLMACAEVLIEGAAEQVPPSEVAANVERYISKMRAHRSWLYRLALFGIELTPLLTLRAPLSLLDPPTRRAVLVEHFVKPPSSPRPLKHAVMIMIRICQQLSFAGYYGDPHSWPSIGYKPFSARPREKPIPDPGPHPLHVIRNEDLGVTELEADVCIVGSGAGGGILAYELAKAGRSVLILERGQYVEPRDFTEDEVGMIGRLYADGVMQQTEDWRFTVLQGSCVGGSTTVNNAVCFTPPEEVVAGWDAIDAPKLYESVSAVESFLHVARQPPGPLNPSGVEFLDAAKARPELADTDIVRANIDGCLGCGYCNIGCKWGHKLSMLETALPWAQRDFPDKVRILSDCEVDRVITRSGSPKRVSALRATLADGRGITVRANTYVLAAGAVGSSYVMLKSGVGGVPVGKGFSCNMGAPLTAEFATPQRAYAGLQISHYGLPKERGFAFETWFNPPVSQALNMPGWFRQHFDNMRRYEHMMAVGVIVGTGSYGSISKALTGGPGINFTPRAEDLRTLHRGLRLLAEILFEAGAERVMLNAWDPVEMRSADDLGKLEPVVMDTDNITLGTGHPQGGNPIGLDAGRSVVDADFRVHGYANLHVCDASVFPSSLTVNPQLTVMSVAHYAAARIA